MLDMLHGRCPLLDHRHRNYRNRRSSIRWLYQYRSSVVHQGWCWFLRHSCCLRKIGKQTCLRSHLSWCRAVDSRLLPRLPTSFYQYPVPHRVHPALRLGLCFPSLRLGLVLVEFYLPFVYSPIFIFMLFC